MLIDGSRAEVDKGRQVAIEAWTNERGWRTWGQAKEAEDDLEGDKEEAEDDGEDEWDSEEENENVGEEENENVEDDVS